MRPLCRSGRRVPARRGRRRRWSSCQGDAGIDTNGLVLLRAPGQACHLAMSMIGDIPGLRAAPARCVAFGAAGIDDEVADLDHRPVEAGME